MSKSEIEAAFYTQAQAHSGTNFQSWFKGIGEVLHEGSEFSEVTQTQGDGGLDFVVISQGIVYQVYGPQDRVTDAKLAKKVTDDFPKAINTMGDNLKVWRLLINQRGTGLGKKSTAVLAKLTDKHSEVGMSVWWLDRLWDELMLPAEKSQARLMKLAKILGVSGFKPDYVEQSDKLHIEAQELCNAGNAKEAFDKAKEALSLIKHHADAEAILRALSILIIIGSQLRVESSLQRYGEEMEKYFPQVSNDKLLVNYYRAKSILARIACDPVQERAAIEQGMALLEKLDGDFALVQFCVFCVNLIGLACREKDFELAQQWTSKAMDRLNAYRGEEHDPLLLELTHVRIWCAVLAKDEAELAACVRMLDEHGNGSEIAERFAEALANNAGQLRHDKFPKVAQQAAQAALRLAHKLHMKENFILGVTYNLAVAKCECGDIDGGKASLKPLLNLPASQQNDMLKGAAMQLLSIIEREAGRFEQSVNYGQDALVHIADARE
jgi:tetratricopeptide (TPR) repeat protein